MNSLSPLPCYVTAWRMSFRRNLQYRGQHMVNNIASAVFGFIYIALWQAVMAGQTAGGEFTHSSMTLYIATCQCLLWVTTFDHSGLRIARRVRDGTIASELLRPVSFAWLQLAQIIGVKSYNFIFRSAVIAVIFRLAVDFSLPPALGGLALAAAAWIIAGYLGALMTYFVGLAGFWTTEPSWMYLLLQSLALFLGGASIPVELLPGPVATIARMTPFPCLAYYPASIHLGWSGARTLLVMAFWAVALTVLAIRLTAAARRRLEVAGG